MSGTQSRRQGDILPACAGIDDEDVGAGHALALSQCYPLQRRGALDLEEDVAITRGGGAFGDVDAVGDVFGIGGGVLDCLLRGGCGCCS